MNYDVEGGTIFNSSQASWTVTTDWRTGRHVSQPAQPVRDQWTPPVPPGLFPKRPLSLGEILDGSFRLIRFTPALNFGLPVIVITLLTLLAGAVGAGLLWFFSDTLSNTVVNDDAANGVFVLIEGISAIVSLVFVAVVQFFAGMTALSARDAFDGKKLTLKDGWSRARGRRWALAGATCTLVGLFLVFAAVFFAPSVILALTVGEIAGILAFLFGGLLWFAATAFMLVKFAFVGPLIAYERLPFTQAFRRSWTLTNRGFWRILGELFLGYFLSSQVVQIMVTPLLMMSYVVVFLVMIATGFSYGSALTVVFVGIAVVYGAALVAAVGLMYSYWSALIVMVFFDQKMRTEGFDLVILREAEQRIQAQTRNEGETTTKDQWLTIPEAT